MQIVRKQLIYVLPALLAGLLVESVMAQSNDATPTRNSRFRFVDSTPKPQLATVQEQVSMPEKHQAPQVMNAISQSPKSGPKKEQVEAANNVSPVMQARLPVIKTAYQSQAVEGKLVSATPVSSRPVRHVMEPQQQIAGGYDDNRAQYERLQYEKSLTQPFDSNLVRVIPQDVYKVFPRGSDMAGYSTELFTHEQQCCDEWAGLCRMKQLDYKCGCGGLKANPGHYGQPWLRGCDNCETTCGCKLRGGKGINARCGKSCLNKSMERANSRINKRDNCGCKACTTVDRNAVGCNDCAAAAPQVMAPAPRATAGSCDCAECQNKVLPAIARTVPTEAPQVVATHVAKKFSNLKEALSSKAASTKRRTDVNGSSRSNWQDILR